MAFSGRKRKIDGFFKSSVSKISDGGDDVVGEATSSSDRSPPNRFAQTLGQRLDCSPTYLTNDGESWYLLKRRWMESTKDQFLQEWETHPTVRHKLKLFGRVVEEKRWSQSWGVSYAYSGSTNLARPINESELVPSLIAKVNELVKDIIPLPHDDGDGVYNGCLQNWYTPEDTIGLHSDDERSQRSEFPIFSLSWGGTRRFLFRERRDKKQKLEIFLKDGDLLVMGGTCQQTHYHEVPKVRKTKDPPTSNRINFTIRTFKAEAK